MSVHEQFADDILLYALGELTSAQRAELEKHLQTCVDCRHDLEQLRGDMALLALSATGAEPPLRSRERLMSAIAKEPRRAQLVQRPQPQRRVWWRPFAWAAGAAAAIVIMLLLHQNANLQRSIAGLEADSTVQQQQLTQAKDMMASLTSADAEHFILVGSKTPPQPQGKAIYVRRSGTLVFLANNMPALPPQKAYELWLIPTAGAPIPAGVFKPGASGNATVINPPLPAGIEAKTFAITVEPEAGSAVPTSQPIMVAAQS
jgi:anti-sigma-K factor RskA